MLAFASRPAPDRRPWDGRGTLLALGAAAAALVGSARASDPIGSEAWGSLRLNQLQYIGTHNSYHVAPDPKIFDYMRRSAYQADSAWPPERLIPALSYTHPSLTQQLEAGVRNLEIDVFFDPAGGRFARPGAVATLAKTGETVAGAPADIMARPGFKVMHMADLDFQANCRTLLLCLGEIRAWSDAHPGHLPVVVMIEAKDGATPPLSDDYVPAPVDRFSAPVWRALEAEILSLFPRDRLITPDLVRGDDATLKAGIARHGWPRVEAMRGRVLLSLNAKHDGIRRYLAWRPGGHGGLFFFDDGLDDPETGWVFRNDPRSSDILDLVRDGYLVYTRADADTVEARRNDVSRRDRAFAAAQIISTDYPQPVPGVGPYQVSFPGRTYVRPDPALAGARPVIPPSR